MPNRAEEKVVVQVAAGVPDDHKRTKGHGDAEKLHQTVKQEIVVQACRVEPREHQTAAGDMAVRDIQFFRHAFLLFRFTPGLQLFILFQ
ncbi:MAG: hypothetical protein ACD_75C02576G0002 [uncultured bacterium]|nr:MAG: hypothetical protein ACD_75C02576G0002 [uncultured bacterium]